MSLEIQTVPYVDRKTWLIDVCEIASWKLKVYGIISSGQTLDNQTIDAAKSFIEKNVAWPKLEGPKYDGPKYGFVTLHAGEHAIWLLVDCWVEDILHHYLYRAPIGEPTTFGPGPDDATSVCVWELLVTNHERDAWVKHVLSDPANPSYEDYLADRLEISGR